MNRILAAVACFVAFAAGVVSTSDDFMAGIMISLLLTICILLILLMNSKEKTP